MAPYTLKNVEFIDMTGDSSPSPPASYSAQYTQSLLQPLALEIRNHFQRTQRRQAIIDNIDRKPQLSLSDSTLSALSSVSSATSEIRS